MAMLAPILTLHSEMLVVLVPHHPRQHHEAVLLAIVEALIERLCRIGEMLQRRAARA